MLPIRIYYFGISDLSRYSIDMVTVALLRFDVIHYTSHAPSQLAGWLTVERKTVNPRLSRYP